MDVHTQMLIDEYLENQNTYKKIQQVVEDTLNGFAKKMHIEVNSITSRIKTKESLEGKLALKGFKYKSIKDVTDIVGARIVTFYSSEVDKFAALVEKTFKVDWENSIDKRKIYNVDQFGYMSLHFVCTLPESLVKDEAIPALNELKFEIQIRTNLQHTWASIYHDTGYKNDVEIPKEYLRSLTRLAGLLEIADSEFQNIKSSIDEYRRNVKNIVKSGDFSEIELNGDSWKAYIESGIFDELTHRIARINNMEIENVSILPYLNVLKVLEFKTLGDVDNFRKKYSELAYQYALRKIEGTDLDIIASSVAIHNLCLVYILSEGGGEMGIKIFYNVLYGEGGFSQRMVRSAVEVGNRMGIAPKEE